jgi:NAD(P)H-hydrate epimerase
MSNDFYLTREQARAVDRIAADRFGLPSLLLMENAAAAVAREALRLSPCNRGTVVVVCGTGNNAGDGLAAARHLEILGVATHIVLVRPEAEYSESAALHLSIIRRMGLPIHRVSDLPQLLPAASVCVDAMLGTGLDRAPDQDYAEVIRTINSLSPRTLSADIPSGLDCDRGEPLGECVRAQTTVTFVAPKAGFANPRAAAWLGRVVVAGIGCPPQAVLEAMQGSAAGSGDR